MENISPAQSIVVLSSVPSITHAVVVVPPNRAVGQYLERPVLHHTIGTKIRPGMLKEMQQLGVNAVYAHPEPPPFEAEMIRGMANAAHDPDWQTRMLGSYQQKSTLEAARRGAVSDEAGSSYVPALARGENFGRSGLTQGWHVNPTSKSMQ